MTTTVAHREQLPDQVATYVRELILSGSVEPGAFLRMEPIADALGISNTPVREGLLTLRNEGFLRLLPRRGFIVEPFSRGDIRDLYWAQAQLTGELTARATRLITPELRDRLRRTIDLLERVTEEGDAERIARAGHDFHRQINLAARSHRLAALAGSIANHLPIRLYAGIEAQIDGLAHEHTELLDVMATGDADTARKLMVRHVRAGGERLIEALDRRSVWQDPAGRRVPPGGA